MIEIAQPPKDHRTRIGGIKALRETYGLPLGEADALLKRAPVTLPELKRPHEERALRRKLTEAGVMLTPEPPDPKTLTHIKMPFKDACPDYVGPFCGQMDCLTLCGESTFEVSYVRTSLAEPAPAEHLRPVSCPACEKSHAELAQVKDTQREACESCGYGLPHGSDVKQCLACSLKDKR